MIRNVDNMRTLDLGTIAMIHRRKGTPPSGGSFVVLRPLPPKGGVPLPVKPDFSQIGIGNRSNPSHV